MPKKYFVIDIAPGVQIHVYFETLNGVVVNYVAKLVKLKNTKFYEIIRYDNAHGCPHKDILDINGKVIRKTWYDFFDNHQILDMAIKDLKDNYALYIERFEKWQEK